MSASTAEKAKENRSKQNQITGKLIFKVNGKNISNLEDFRNIVAESKDGEFVRLFAKDLIRGEVTIHDIRLDLEYWKTRDMYLNEKKDWVSHIVQHLD